MQCARTLLIVLASILISDSPVSARDTANLASSEMHGNVVDLRTDAGMLIRMTFLDEDLLRIQATSGEEPTELVEGRAAIVLPIEKRDVSLKRRIHGDLQVFSTSAMVVMVRPKPLRLELHRVGGGQPLWRELKPLDLNNDATTQTLDSSRGEHFYGGGQQNGAYQFKGRLMEISYSGGWEEGDRPSPAPFYMSDRGYGVLRNTWSDGVYDFRSDNYLTTTHAENRFDAYYMVGETIHEVLDLYTRLTGRARLLPRWGFEFGDADCFNDSDNVIKPGTTPEGWSDGPTGTTPDVIATVAAKYREHDMPGGWILPNDGYGCGYDDLPSVVRGLRELGFRTGLWTEDGVERIAWEVGEAGIRVQKLDVAWTGQGYQWALDANHDAAQGFLDNSDSRPFIWTVMGWAGMQRYAVTWTGDQSGSWDSIRWHVPTLIGSGLSGMNYSTGDVDGIFGGSPETFTRDLQWKCFTPVLMGMSGWSRAERKHPWWFDEPYRSVNRRYLTLRQRLMPYIYNLAYETEVSGAPMVRGIVWDHPEDPHANDHPTQFFLGRDLLVAPVYRSQAASGGWRDAVYLPKGRWIDYWTGVVIDAGADGRLVDIPVDLGTLPVLVRAGAIIPMYPESLYDGQVPHDPLTLDVYPHGDSELVLYEDDGNTRAYLAGEHSLQRFVVAADDPKTIDITIGGADGDFDGVLELRSFVVHLHTRIEPQSISIDGETMTSRPTPEAFVVNERGWHYDADDRFGTIHVKTGRLGTRQAHHLRVSMDPRGEPAVTGGCPQKPDDGGTISRDDLMVIGRPAEEPGHPLENAFDGDPDTWFRSVRDQSVAYGPHELTLSLGRRRVIEGLRISPRNDTFWKYGQVRRYEIYLADVNGNWGEPVASGALEQTEDPQEVRFAPRAGRLLRFRVLSTHDDGVDPMVLGAAAAHAKAYDALAPVRVGPVTISELQFLERPTPPRAQISRSLADDPTAVRMNGLSFGNAFTVHGSTRIDFELDGDWQALHAEAGIDDLSPAAGTVQMQVWGNDRLLWDSGPIAASTIVKPRVDIRGVTTLSLRTVTADRAVTATWAETVVIGFEGDTITPRGH